MTDRATTVREWFPKALRATTALVCALILGLPPIQARTKQGDKYLKLGAKAEAERKWDVALNYYDQALATDSQDALYMISDQRVRNKALEAHLAEGRRLQQQQRLEEALIEFQKAFLADPGSQVSLQLIRETTGMIKEKSKLPTGVPVLTPAERAREEMERRINSLEGPPTLRSLNTPITSIKINNQPSRVLFESIGKLAGINVLFDPQGLDTTGGKNFNLDLTNVTLEEALNYVALETHAFWKPISHNAIFVTQETDPKRQEYQDEVVKVFYIQNAVGNEFNEIFNGVRQGAKLMTGVMSVPSQNAIVVRGTVDTVALAEKLIHDLDRPKPEVLIDVIVLEINKTKGSTIGASLLGQGGLTAPLNFTPRNSIAVPSTTTGTTTGTTTSTTTGTTTSTTTGTTTSTTTGTTTSTGTGSSIPLSSVRHLSTADYSVSLPSTIIQALMNDSTTHVLQRPQLRASDNGKASLKVGQKIPYVSGSLNSAVATPGSIPYATTQFQQIDVGTNIDLTPHVSGPDEISMHVKVDITNLLQWLTIAGVQEPEIGQQVDEADIRMKDGEVSILGGLTDKELSTALSGVPGFANIPVLGYLFGSTVKSTTDNEILIALIPHILRAPDLTAMGEPGIYAGSERVTKVERKPQGTAVSAEPSTIPVTPPTPLTPAANPHPQTQPVNPPAAAPAKPPGPPSS